jgi:hypothetical protein
LLLFRAALPEMTKLELVFTKMPSEVFASAVLPATWPPLPLRSVIPVSFE